MVGFCDLSDTDESSIEDIISQAQDACVLEQLSAINCSAFTNSVLPSHLESRFRKLKSLPTNRTTPPPYDSKVRSFSTLNSRNLHDPLKGNHQSPNLSPSKEIPENPRKDPDSGCVSSPSDSSHGKKSLKEKPKHGSVSPPFGSLSGSSSYTSEESSMSSLFKPKEGKFLKQNKSMSSSPLRSLKSSRGSPSPPKKVGCFWCSPKKEKKKKSIENVLGWDGSDELLSGLGSLSFKEQQKLMKKAMKEEEKISREAEKIVEWAKHASARMNVSGIEDELSDD